MRKIKWWQQLLYQLGFVLIALFVIVPLWGLAQMAFDGSLSGWPLEFRLWPKEFTLDVFRAMWGKPAQTLSFLNVLKNSLIVAGGAAELDLKIQHLLQSFQSVESSRQRNFIKIQVPGERQPG